MGIFVEETAAFIIGGLIGAAILYVHLRTAGTEAAREVYFLGWLFLAICLLLAAIGILDVALDHLGSDTPQTATP